MKSILVFNVISHKVSNSDTIPATSSIDFLASIISEHYEKHANRAKCKQIDVIWLQGDMKRMAFDISFIWNYQNLLSVKVKTSLNFVYDRNFTLNSALKCNLIAPFARSNIALLEQCDVNLFALTTV